jgi:hypothetical protein
LEKYLQAVAWRKNPRTIKRWGHLNFDIKEKWKNWTTSRRIDDAQIWHMEGKKGKEGGLKLKSYISRPDPLQIFRTPKSEFRNDLFALLLTPPACRLAVKYLRHAILVLRSRANCVGGCPLLFASFVASSQQPPSKLIQQFRMSPATSCFLMMETLNSHFWILILWTSRRRRLPL